MLESPPTKGVGGSSAMPHKRNPVACLQALAAAPRAPGLMATLLSGSLGEHERALGGWQAELVTIPELVDAAGSALDALERIAAGLVVNAERMRANLDALQGLVFSERLARVIARDTDRASALGPRRRLVRRRGRRAPASQRRRPRRAARRWPASSTRSSRSRRSSASSPRSSTRRWPGSRATAEADTIARFGQGLYPHHSPLSQEDRHDSLRDADLHASRRQDGRGRQAVHGVRLSRRSRRAARTRS